MTAGNLPSTTGLFRSVYIISQDGQKEGSTYIIINIKNTEIWKNQSPCLQYHIDNLIPAPRCKSYQIHATTQTL